MLGTAFQQEVLKKLAELDPLYIVGGAVRDARMGIPIRDVDAVTTLSLDALVEKLRFWGYNPHRLGTHKQTITLFHENERIDLAYFPGNVQEDARHRDFTINALYQNIITGATEDPLGGLDDLKNRVLRACGDPSERFQEDPLRVLRLVRLAVAYGLEVEEKTWQAAVDSVPQLTDTAIERITEELGKILVMTDVEKAVRMLDFLGYFDKFVPELARLKGLVQNRYHAKDAWEHTLHVLRNTEPQLLLRLAALFHDLGKWETASRECYVWGKLEKHEGKYYVGEYHVVGKALERWKNKYVKVHGARLDNYPDTVQVKNIKAASTGQGGFEWVPDGKRHFLGHEKESVRLTKEILPRFRWSMVLNSPEYKGETELIYIIANHMSGTLTFMNELRGDFQSGSWQEKAKKFAWEHGWNGRSFHPARVNNILALWRADFFGGKQRVEDDRDKFDKIQQAIKSACTLIEERINGLDWNGFEAFARTKELSGVRYGDFKEYMRQRLVFNAKLSLNDPKVLEREWREFTVTLSCWRK